jgi:phosphotransferase system enzyme I (PtsI)
MDRMGEIVQGIGVSPGAVVGPAAVVPVATAIERATGTPDEEQRAYDRAAAESRAQLEQLAGNMRAQGLAEQAGILDAQALMVQDPGWAAFVAGDIAAGISAPEAVTRAAGQFAAMFEGLDDPYMAARAADVRDVATRLQEALSGETGLPRLTRPSIIVAHDLTPSQTAGLDRNLVLAFATETGNETAHTAILARALGIPAVVGVPALSTRVTSGEEIALDGERGTIVIDPDEVQRREHVDRMHALAERRHRLRSIRDQPAETRDGRRLVLAANIGSPDDVPAALDAGAEGVGLFRTEFLFAGRTSAPDEEEQTEAYRAVLSAWPEHRVVIRTLDIGGDKPLPFLPQTAEANPFLGRRGIRYTAAHPEILQSQLRALLRASSAGRLSVMIPMVSELAQIEEIAAVLAEAQSEVGGAAELGIMVEVPAAALLADRFARHVAFLSVGTNDLTQYTLAVDRGNETVASLYRPLHPAILRLLEQTTRGAHEHGRWAGICGEMAGDLRAIPLLIGLDIDELSMTPARIPEARARIRALDHAVCRDLAARALECETAEEVETLIRQDAPPG